MALIKCSECGKEISDKASQCIHCGCHVSPKKLSNIPKCEVKISGEEKLNKNTAYLYGSFMLFSLLFAVISFGVSEHGNGMGAAILFIISAIFLHKGYKAQMKKYKSSEKIYEFFKSRYPIYKEFTPNMENLGLITETSSSNDEAMFNIFMQAYKKDADGIVLNSNTTSTHVSGGGSYAKGRSSSVSSHVSHNAMATIIKFKE
ncbi:MAG: zinc ribbon domain-containing protein [Sulfurovaceae bacterium]